MNPSAIPLHLTPFVVEQDASLYTPIDQAVWRYIMRVSRAFFKKHAHPMYRDGVQATGLSIDRIPLISEMNEKLNRFGWQAVAVSGFIPPSVFLEFQSRGILPIACDIRQIEHISYTPAPDIIHEAAGHAPIVADAEYRKYLTHYGEVAYKAIFSKKDMDVYEAVRELSEVKEDPASTPAMVAQVERALDAATAQQDYVSEATQLGRMAWWTTEYGLVGSLENPLIYGAGLLSAIGESFHCFDPKVKKIPFSLDCINRSYDITRPQPQLYVAKDFTVLSQTLGEFASTMAFKVGGAKALTKAKAAESVTTTVLETGLGISGILESFTEQADGKIIFLKWNGPVQLTCGEKEIPGQGPTHHAEGFSTPIGRIRGLGKSTAELTPSDLEHLGFKENQMGKLTFESGIELSARFKSSIPYQDQNLILTFTDCTIRYQDQILYRPEYGSIDVACGSEVVSVYGGAGDRPAYLQATGGYRQAPRRPKTNLTDANRKLNEFYAEVRGLRESVHQTHTPEKFKELLLAVFHQVNALYPKDWLIHLEILELLKTRHRIELQKSALLVEEKLLSLRSESEDYRELIDRGLALLKEPG